LKDFPEFTLRASRIWKPNSGEELMRLVPRPARP